MQGLWPPRRALLKNEEGNGAEAGDARWCSFFGSLRPQFPQGLGVRDEGGPLGCFSIAFGCWADNAWFPVSFGET